MDWTYPAAAGEAGIFEIGRRLAIHLGRLPDATSFIHDAREMLRVTRRMESAALSGTLLAGFQNAAKFDLEATRYRDLAAGGTRVTVYGTSRPSQSLTDIDYRELAPDSRKLENQWFLVSDAPEPIAFVSWELGDASGFGVGGAAAEGKRFVGFVSDDPEVVSELVDALGRVPGLVTATAAAAETGISSRVDEWALAIVSAVEGIVPPETGAAGGAVVVPVGRADSDGALRLAISIARAEGRPLVLVDRSGEGMWGSPYSDLRGDDELRPRKEVLFGADLARREGRGRTASALDAAAMLGVTAGGWFPTAAGADGLNSALKRFHGAILVVPTSAGRPSIGERIRGMTLDKLERLGVPVIIAN